MCVVSMVMDHYRDKWAPYIPSQPGYWPPPTIPLRPVRIPTPDELDEFRRLMDRARDYDRRNNEPDCENDGKRQILLDMAKVLGVDISFIDDVK